VLSTSLISDDSLRWVVFEKASGDALLSFHNIALHYLLTFRRDVIRDRSPTKGQ